VSKKGLRIGKAPTRQSELDYEPARVTICILVCIPNQLGYYSQRLEILKVCLASIFNHTPAEAYDLMVFDNASCREVVEYLQKLHEEGVIQYLHLSRANIGVINADRMMWPSAPGQIVAYSDDDVYFYPGWLEDHLEVLETFPNVGMVSGRCGEQAGGQGKDVLLEHGGVKAFSTAKHYQFIAPKSVLLEVIEPEWRRRTMGGRRAMDKRVDALGYARLTTQRRCVEHIGNVLTPEFLAMLDETPSMRPLTA
jgi:glycosyltransferase involved in cell wall biosynthesis